MILSCDSLITFFDYLPAVRQFKFYQCECPSGYAKGKLIRNMKTRLIDYLFRSRSKKMHLYRWLCVNVNTYQSTCFRWKLWECSVKILWSVIHTHVWPWNNFPCSDFCKLCNNLSNFSWIPTDSQKVKQSECSFRHGEVRPLSPLSV